MENRENKQKKKRLPFKRTLQNNVFAIKVFLAVSPLYLVIYLALSQQMVDF